MNPREMNSKDNNRVVENGSPAASSLGADKVRARAAAARAFADPVFAGSTGAERDGDL
jgi:hypothetical protein